MRIAVVNRNFNLAGSLERDTVLLARGLASLGVDVHCYCNPETRADEFGNVVFHDVRPLLRSSSRLGYPTECGSFAAAATRALRRDRASYDIVHVSGIAAWEHDVVTVHGVWKAEGERWPEQAGRNYRAARLRAFAAPVTRPHMALARTIQRLQFRPGRFARAVAVTDVVRDDLVRVLRVPPDLIEVVPYPIDLESFMSEDGRGWLRPSLGLSESDQILLFVGHGFERKGLADAIASLAGLDASVHLVVVGGGDATPFRNQAAELGVEPRVHFVGKSDRPERFYRDADLFVLPTQHDPWGIPLIEAMAAGVPVVSTAVAGAADEVRRARTGMILADGSPPGLGNAISALLRDPVERRAMAARGRAVAQRFSVEARARTLADIFARVLTERGSKDGRAREAL